MQDKKPKYHKQLTDRQIAAMELFKGLETEFKKAVNTMDWLDPRNRALAVTHMEDAIYRANRAAVEAE